MASGPESVEINLASGAVAVPFHSSQISPDQRFISLTVDVGKSAAPDSSAKTLRR